MLDYFSSYRLFIVRRRSARGFLDNIHCCWKLSSLRESELVLLSIAPEYYIPGTAEISVCKRGNKLIDDNNKGGLLTSLPTG